MSNTIYGAGPQNKITSVHGLIGAYQRKHPNSHYFDSDTLRFFGERISEMRLLKGTTEVTDSLGEKHICYCLSSLQRNHPLGPRRKYTYFDVETLDDI